MNQIFATILANQNVLQVMSRNLHTPEDQGECECDDGSKKCNI